MTSNFSNFKPIEPTTAVDDTNISASKHALILYSIVLLEGFVSVALEILFIRQLVPFVGTNVVVTSIIIGIFLLFLALGYWRGGLCSENFYGILWRNFLWSAALTGVGLSYIFVAYFFTAFYFINAHMLLALVLYLLFIMAPLVYLLGQTIPIIMNLVKREKLVGTIGGKVLFLSTMGSFLGAILTTLLLMELWGVAWTIFINFLILLLLLWMLVLIAPIGSIKKKNNLIYPGLALLVIAVYVLNVGFARQYFAQDNDYANYHISSYVDNSAAASTIPHTYNIPRAEGQIGKVLQINGSYSSFIDNQKRGFPYIELIKNILFQDLKITNKNILVLGAGGFTLSAANTYGNAFTYVDIDEHIKSVVEKNFLHPVSGTFVPEDARVYLNQNHKLFDVIVSDVYSNVNTIPPELLTIEHFYNIKRALTKDGFAIFNIIANPLLKDAYSKRIHNTITAVFKSCMSIPFNYNNEVTNIIYVCHKGDNESDNKVYTDDKNTVTLDFFKKG